MGVSISCYKHAQNSSMTALGCFTSTRGHGYLISLFRSIEIHVNWWFQNFLMLTSAPFYRFDKFLFLPVNYVWYYNKATWNNRFFRNSSLVLQAILANVIGLICDTNSVMRQTGTHVIKLFFSEQKNFQKEKDFSRDGRNDTEGVRRKRQKALLE